MAVCTFFGHRDCPDSIKDNLRNTVEFLIRECGASLFYIENHGAFDRLALYTVKELQSIYPHIRYAIVLAYPPCSATVRTEEPTVFPEGLETVLPRFAILQRNQWMLQQADIVVSFVVRPFGGAAQFVQSAKNKGKSVFEIPPP